MRARMARLRRPPPKASGMMGGTMGQGMLHGKMGGQGGMMGNKGMCGMRPPAWAA